MSTSAPTQPSPRSAAIDELIARGFIYQSTDLPGTRAELDKSSVSLDSAVSDATALAQPPAAYIGFDCTAKSLHVGNLMQIMLLRLLQRHGIKPIAILGGATSKIGDPSGRDTAREMMTDETIQQNGLGIKRSLSKFISFGSGAGDALLLNNADWLERIGYIELLRDYGMHFSINRMLTAEKIRSRLENEQELSFLEFNYAILQAYDFLHLNKNYNCVLQIGGSDQWGNIVSGTRLIKRVTGNTAFGITTPLITTASGAKMGKSESGAVWLNADMLSPYDYYQFWRNTDDRDVFRFMLIYTDLSVEQVNEYAAACGQSGTGGSLPTPRLQEAGNINEFKKLLAFEATKLCHGEEAAEAAAKTATAIFEQGDTNQLPEFQLDKSRLTTGNGVHVYEILKESGLAGSFGEAKRLIKGGGAKLNKAVITDELAKLQRSEFGSDNQVVLSSGKKKHVRVVLVTL